MKRHVPLAPARGRGLGRQPSGRILTLIGADGAGKSTQAQRLCALIGERAVYMYLGSNPSAATHTLPSTRAWLWLKGLLGSARHRPGPPEPGPTPRPRRAFVRALQHLKSVVALGPRVSDELYRLFLAEYLAHRGHLVVADRHPYSDYHARRVRGTGGWLRWGDRIHGLLLVWVYPRPKGLTLLDAPAEVLHARKHEGSLMAVRARRQEYLALTSSLGEGCVRVVDVDRPEHEILRDLLRLAQSDGPIGCATPPPPLPGAMPRSR